jgi:acyl-coenzyme A thioesterase PaaI-like protein
MKGTEIPFANKVGIVKAEDGTHELPNSDSIHNHLETIAASAQFALAEISSGEHLKNLFPELVGKVIPVLRDSQIKFKKPATDSINAYPSVSEDSVFKFKSQLERKNRSSISVDVEVKDKEGTVTCVGTFNWYVQSI